MAMPMGRLKLCVQLGPLTNVAALGIKIMNSQPEQPHTLCRRGRNGCQKTIHGLSQSVQILHFRIRIAHLQEDGFVVTWPCSNRGLDRLSAYDSPYSRLIPRM